MSIAGRARPGTAQDGSPQGQRDGAHACSICSIAALALALSVLIASASFADSHESAAPLPADPEVGTTAAPPGTLGPDGMVPEKSQAGAAPESEQIGHVPGPGEGVYGDPPNSGTGDPEGRPWSYDPTYLFALTHGLKTDTDLSPRARRWVSPLTITFDVVTLPTAALAGLSGRAPQADEPRSASKAPAGSEAEPAPANEPASAGDSPA